MFLDWQKVYDLVQEFVRKKGSTFYFSTMLYDRVNDCRAQNCTDSSGHEGEGHKGVRWLKGQRPEDTAPLPKNMKMVNILVF